MFEYKWNIGDLCTMTYGDTGHGIIYRVIEVIPATPSSLRGHGKQEQLKIAPAMGVIASTKHRGKRSCSSAWCTPLTLVDLATAYAKFGEFITEEARRLGA